MWHCPNEPGVDQSEQEAVLMLLGHKIQDVILVKHRHGPVHLLSVHLTLLDIFQVFPLSPPDTTRHLPGLPPQCLKLGRKSWRLQRPGGKVKVFVLHNCFLQTHSGNNIYELAAQNNCVPRGEGLVTFMQLIPRA